MSEELIEVRVESITQLADDINAFDMRPMESDVLPAFTAGAHLDIHLPNGLVRSYSLVNPEGEQHRYVVAVALDRASRGGSSHLHEAVRPGDVLTISSPRNLFPLSENARHSILIAGGIGITPLWCMIQRLVQGGRSWELHYGARNRQSAAFVEALGALPERLRKRVHLNFDDESGGRMLDLTRILAELDPSHHVYCCGPAPMLAAFEQAAAAVPRSNIHVEHFSAIDAPAKEGGFTVVLARSRRILPVPYGKTILEVLLEAGESVPHACQMGTCATCETRVLEGIPDHRDVVLSPEERASNATMIICCSGSLSDRLVLDR